MTDMSYVKGDIVVASKRDRDKGKHYIIVWTDFEEGQDFIGIMLTTATTEEYSDNIALDKTHISEELEFVWKNSHFVNRLFIKFAEWGPFKKVGELSDSGVQYVQSNLQELEPVPFREYDLEHRCAGPAQRRGGA